VSGPMKQSLRLFHNPAPDVRWLVLVITLAARSVAWAGGHAKARPRHAEGGSQASQSRSGVLTHLSRRNLR
jgi:hypothetical protein